MSLLIKPHEVNSNVYNASGTCERACILINLHLLWVYFILGLCTYLYLHTNPKIKVICSLEYICNDQLINFRIYSRSDTRDFTLKQTKSKPLLCFSILEGLLFCRLFFAFSCRSISWLITFSVVFILNG